MAKRLTRSKQKIKAARIPYQVPSDSELPDHLRGVFATLFLVFNEGYLPSGSLAQNRDTPRDLGDSAPMRSGDGAIRTDLCAEAIRLTRILATLMPDEPEVLGLLALMLLTDARRASRVADGALVALADQDRSRWDHDLIAEGHAIVRDLLRRGRPGRYQILAALNAVHTDAGSVEDTDWSQIVALYDQLYAVDPTPVVALNRAVAVAEVAGRRWRSRCSTRSISSGTTPTRPPERTCSVEPGAPTPRSRHTGVRSSWRATRPSVRSSAADSTGWAFGGLRADDARRQWAAHSSPHARVGRSRVQRNTVRRCWEPGASGSDSSGRRCQVMIRQL